VIRRDRARERGFTLLEMIVATTIMAIAVVGLLSGLSGATRNAARLRDYDRAAQLARLRMNELLLDRAMPRNSNLSGPFDAALTGGIEAGWQARLENFEMPPHPHPGMMALDRIELQVWWMSGTERRTFTLDAFRPRVLQPLDFVPGEVPGGAL
jgi:general secretion pathway protein I